MIYGILFWVTIFTLSTFEGMKTWTWFDEICLRAYAKVTSTMWYLEYTLERKRNESD